MRTVARWMLAIGMVFAGVMHLTVARKEFRAQVPPWVAELTPLDEDAVVVGSGVVEIMLGTALVALPRERRRVGAILAAFFVVIFPGNFSQYIERRDGFGLDTDTKRFVRLFFQPVLVIAAIWSTRD